MSLEPPSGPPTPALPPDPPGKAADPAKPGRVRFGLQVAYGLFLAPFAFLVQMLVQGFFNSLQGHWSGAGTFVSGVIGMLTLAAGIWLAVRRGWRGVLNGFILFGALVLLLIGVCFAMLTGFGR